MDRERVIRHLKALSESEKRLARQERPYLDRTNQRRAEQLHWDNVQALDAAVDELQALERVKVSTQQVVICPTPARELDEYVCVRCRMRWDTKEDKPPCKG